MMEVPVYLFTGFLEAGKTKSIQDTLSDERFNSGEKTLLLVCEEGIEEYNTSKFPENSVIIEIIDEETDLNSARLKELNRKHKPERVVIEYNGMWLLESLYRSLPASWFIYQELFFSDSKTFEPYNTNMRSLTVDKLTNCEMVIINRAHKDIDFEGFHKIVRTISTRASICYEYPDGHIEYDEIEDPLPFDIDAPVIEIADKDYAIWFRDFSENMSKYNGKTVKFKCICGVNSKLSDNTIIIGRHIMTCCADDIAFRGLVCIVPDGVKLKNREWIIVTAKIDIKYHSLYEDRGPVLTAETVAITSKPEQEVATFY